MYKLFMNNFSNALDKLAEIRMHVSFLLIPITGHILIDSVKKNPKPVLICVYLMEWVDKKLGEESSQKQRINKYKHFIDWRPWV